MLRIKQLLLVVILLPVGCRQSAPATFTIIEHTTSTGDIFDRVSGQSNEHYVVRYENAGRSVVIDTRCAFTQYPDKGRAVNQGFCPSERLPAIGTSISQCTPQSKTGSLFPPCAYRMGDVLVFHEGGTWGDEEVNLYVLSEKSVK